MDPSSMHSTPSSGASRDPEAARRRAQRAAFMERTPLPSNASSSTLGYSSAASTPMSISGVDPLTPESRMEIASLEQAMPAVKMTPGGSLDKNDLMSPHKALLHTLSSVGSLRGINVGGLSSGNSFKGGIVGASSFASRSLQSSSTGSAKWQMSTPSKEASSASVLAEELKDKSTCGAEIRYYTLIRVRLNNHQCLRISTSPPPTSSVKDTASSAGLSTPRQPTKASPANSVKSTSSRASSTATTANTKASSSVYIDVTGNGLNGDMDQVFVLLNANNRADRGDVHYSDVVALYCIDGTCKGRFLSVDPTTQQLRSKKGPVIGNTEKWRLVNPKVPAGQREESRLFSETITGLNTPAALEVVRAKTKETTSQQAAKLLWEQQRVVLTSDKVLLKVSSAELFLSVQRDPYEAAYTLSLSRENDGMHDLLQHWEITKSNIPYDPAWNRDREYLTGEAFFQQDPKRTTDTMDLNLPPLSTFPISIQERIMVDDLLYTFVGVEGRYIKLEVTESALTPSTLIRMHKFVMNQHGMDPSISTLASRCFCLGEYYLKLAVYVERFSRYEHGQVNHAFCAALKTLMKEYTIVIAQLEHQMKTSPEELSLQKLWYYVQPSLRTMEMLSKLTDACQTSNGGGSLLSVIQHMKSSLAGDTKARQVFSFLMERASVPYLKMVESWIYHGELVDPYDEFMVRSDNDLNPEDLSQNPYSTYWEDRFTSRKQQVPTFLQRVSKKILDTGKYLNIFRTCQRPVDCPFAGPIDFAENEATYDELVDRAHAYASRELLQFLVVENDLLNRLISLKHYFLMDQGDFFVDFMHAAAAEMKMSNRKIAVSRLESLLHMSLQTSTCAPDPYRDDLICFLSPTSLLSQLNEIHTRATRSINSLVSGSQPPPLASPTSPADDVALRLGIPVVEAFNLDFKVRWPLSLVISCGELTKYQMLFRHLFYCKHVEKKLSDAWLHHQSMKEFNLRAQLARSFCLRQRMLHFQQNLVYYMMVEVISPRWHSFHKKLTAVVTVDNILECHRAFLDLCLKECLLSDPELLRMIYKLMHCCSTMASQLESVFQPYFFDEEQIKAGREEERDRRAEKRARDEADAALMTFHKGAGGRKKPGNTLKRRQSSQLDERRSRIRGLTEDIKQTLTVVPESTPDGGFSKRTANLENEFDSMFREFMNQLIRRSRVQRDAHLSNLCTRLDYNGYYASQPQ
ncbi:hypothetical protein Poli38472_000237 [Pythium oligandrum]|uniref:Spindle pole body component n=1 Tax=Pythium oligandrum TaxID=41045 RepID=A0A8K1FE65_PYTOL|nr:hypothetical protein Poli38472_000237 [Pythium oligandrum]|eukprot:TMW60195.1 hypothetical protein Poli38472_000237 [Pythium oligandrum]